MSSPGYLVRSIEDAPVVPCLCGESVRPLTFPEVKTCSLHVPLIFDSVKHHHRIMTEIYYVLEGIGEMELNSETVAVKPGSVIYIEPGVRHKLKSAGGVKTIVFSVPAFLVEDEYTD